MFDPSHGWLVFSRFRMEPVVGPIQGVRKQETRCANYLDRFVLRIDNGSLRMSSPSLTRTPKA